jgi:hypothetical protein
MRLYAVIHLQQYVRRSYCSRSREFYTVLLTARGVKVVTDWRTLGVIRKGTGKTKASCCLGEQQQVVRCRILRLVTMVSQQRHNPSLKAN